MWVDVRISIDRLCATRRIIACLPRSERTLSHAAALALYFFAVPADSSCAAKSAASASVRERASRTCGCASRVCATTGFLAAATTPWLWPSTYIEKYKKYKSIKLVRQCGPQEYTKYTKHAKTKFIYKSKKQKELLDCSKNQNSNTRKLEKHVLVSFSAN